jgi:hypothetical protein
MSQKYRRSIIAKWQKATFVFICTSAVISLLTLGLWIFGVPGVQNEYAKGWALGLKTLYRYLIGSCLTLTIYFVFARLSSRFPVFDRLQIILLVIFWLFFGYSAFNLFRALQIMA